MKPASVVAHGLLRRSHWVLLLSLGQAASVVLLTGSAILLPPEESTPGEPVLRAVFSVAGPVVFAIWIYAFLAPLGRPRNTEGVRLASRRRLLGLSLAYAFWWIALVAYGILLGSREAFNGLLWLVPACALVASHLNAPRQHMALLWMVLFAQAGGLVLIAGVALESTTSIILDVASSFLLTFCAYQLYRIRVRDNEWNRGLAKERQEEKNYLVQQVAHLQEANAAKSRLLAMVSHDLRQPVHALGLMLGRLRREASVTSLRVEVDEVNEVVHSLSESLNMLMAVTRLNSGRMTAHAEPVSLTRLFDSLAYEFQHVAAVRGLGLEFDSGGLGVYTDPAHLRTILNNLLGNAIKYSQQGTVRLQAESQPGDKVVISVRDEGVGIPHADLSRIFEPFVRLRYHKTSADGIGLGLAIVKQTADLIRVPIEVTSEVGEGTLFTLTLPRCETARSKVTRHPEVMLRGLRVVVVDNDDTVLGSMASTLEELGCRVIAAGGWESLEVKLAMTVSPIDLIVTDYHLDAGTSGYELIVRLRQQYGEGIPAILLTGDVEIRHGSDGEADNIVIAYKPLSYDKLARLIEEVASRGANRP